MPLRKYAYADMLKYHQTRRDQCCRWRKRTGSNLYPTRPWTADEEALVMDYQGPDRELSEQIHRSVIAIQAHRVRMRQKMGVTINADDEN